MHFYNSSMSQLKLSERSASNVSCRYFRRDSGWLRIAYLLIGIMLLAGCAKEKEAAATKPYQDLTIRVAVPKGWQFKDSWDVQLEEWSARTGAKVELVETDAQNLTLPLLSSESPPQLMLLPWTRRGELLVDRRLQPFPEPALDESQLHWNDVLQGLREKQCTADGGPYLMPLSEPVLVCYYRADLLEKAGLKPPESWNDYQTLLDRLASWAPGLTAVEPWAPEFRSTMFMARAVSYVKSPGQLSVFFEVDNGKPYISSPGFVRALQVAQAAVKKLPPEVLGYDPIACRNLIVSGKAALAIGLESGPDNWPLTLGAATPKLANRPREVHRADKISIGVCQLPGANQVYNSTFENWEAHEKSAYRVTYTGFAGLCAAVPRPTSIEQSAAAINLLASLIHDSGSQFPPATRSAVRESDLTNAGAWVGHEFSAEEAASYVAVVARSLRDRQQVSELPVVGHAEFRAALTNGLRLAIEENRPAAEVLATIDLEWKEILKKLGQDRVLKSYRRALGLSERLEY
jgi:multiple sugar transport system substrate-binding protein